MTLLEYGFSGFRIIIMGGFGNIIYKFWNKVYS
jgi:hypothetical protein